MGYNKGHIESTSVNLSAGFRGVPGYPHGFFERILAGALDEKNKIGNDHVYLAHRARCFSTVPFVHGCWEEVFLIAAI